MVIRKTLALTMMLIVGVLSFGVVAAQEEVTPEVTPEVNLENVTANHETFYGQEVTLTGVIEEFVNVRTFVLGENAALDDDKVLVINNTGHEFYLWIHKDLNVSVTGVVYPSINEGGLAQIASGSPGLVSTVEALAPGLSAATLEPTLEGGLMPTEDMSGTMPTMEATLPSDMATEDMSGGAVATMEATLPSDMATEDASGGAMTTLEAPSLDSSTTMATEDTSGSEMATMEATLPASGDMTEDTSGSEMATMEATLPSDVTATEEMSREPTIAPTEAMTPTPEPLDFASMELPADYGDYTIIVISSIDSVVYVEPAAQ